jgi:phage antirepressor YoqD-like protein
MSDERKPYEILSSTKVRLGPTARELAKLSGVTEQQMARFLLEQNRLRESGQIQKDGEV